MLKKSSGEIEADKKKIGTSMKISKPETQCFYKELSDGTVFEWQHDTEIYMKTQITGDKNGVKLSTGEMIWFQPKEKVVPYYNSELRLKY